MRTFETVLWLMSSTWVAWLLVGKPTRRIHAALLGAGITTGVLHVALEGVRVHMIPVYVLLAAQSVLALWRQFRPAASRPPLWIRFGAGLTAAVWLAIGIVLPSLFPVFTYDQPKGPYGIGTAIYELKNGPLGRDLVIQAWYPIARGVKGHDVGITTNPVPLEAAYASFSGLPRLMFDNLRLVRTHATANAPMAADTPRFPVVLFSHGPLGANRSQSVFQMEALASAGFVAIAIDHTRYASATIFPDGHVVLPGPEAAWPVFVDDRSTAMLKTWVADVRFVIDQLETLNHQEPADLLTSRLDLSRIGYVGASFGGSVVVQALLDEPRIKAGVAEDGKPYFSDDTLTDLHRPLMYMQSAAPYIKSSDAQLARWGLTAARFKIAEQDHYVRQMQLFGRANGPIYNVYIRETNHLTFSDLDLIIRVPDRQLMNIRRAHGIINDYTIAFFERYLNGVPAPLVDGRRPSPYQEVTVASRNVQTLEQSARAAWKSLN